MRPPLWSHRESGAHGSATFHNRDRASSSQFIGSFYKRYLPITGSGVFETAAQAIHSVKDQLPDEVVLYCPANTNPLSLCAGWLAFLFFSSALIHRVLWHWPDAVLGKNLVHLLKVRGAVHHHLLLQLDVDGDAGKHSLNESRPVESLWNTRERRIRLDFKKKNIYIYRQGYKWLCCFSGSGQRSITESASSLRLLQTRTRLSVTKWKYTQKKRKKKEDDITLTFRLYVLCSSPSVILL